MAMKPAGAAAHFVSYDGNGNVVALVDGNRRHRLGKLRIWPLWETVRATGTIATTNRYGFSTKFTDDESDFVYYGYRYYSPSTGRWLSRDPIGEKGGNNPYRFAANSAINFFDELGLCAPCIPNWVKRALGGFSANDN